MLPTSDLHVVETRPLVAPAILHSDLPLSDRASETVRQTRQRIQRILRGEDQRLLVIVGPCSVHDVAAAEEYAGALALIRERLKDSLEIVMRVYFEKPRTTVGWKGLINDPHLDGSYDINTGLRRARSLLLQLAERGLPAATELLDPIVLNTSLIWSAGRPLVPAPPRAKPTARWPRACRCPLASRTAPMVG